VFQLGEDIEELFEEPVDIRGNIVFVLNVRLANRETGTNRLLDPEDGCRFRQGSGDVPTDLTRCSALPFAQFHGFLTARACIKCQTQAADSLEVGLRFHITSWRDLALCRSVCPQAVRFVG
jgi:hypothetical protein